MMMKRHRIAGRDGEIKRLFPHRSPGQYVPVGHSRVVRFAPISMPGQ